MKNIFSKNVFKQAIKKLTLVSILTGLLSTMITTMLISNHHISGHNMLLRFDFDYMLYGSRGYTAVGVAPILLVVMFLCSALFTYISFNYQNKRSSADKFHSLPYTRTQQYVSRIFAILTMLYGVIILTMVTAWVTLNTSDSIYIFRYLILGTLGFMAGTTLIVGIMATAMSFTGNLLSNFTTATVLLFLPRCILFLIGMLITQTSYQIVNLNELNVFLNPSTNIPVGMILDVSKLWQYNGVSEILISPKSIIYTFVLGMAYLVIAMLISNKRKSELAGKSFINKNLSYAFAGLCVMPILSFSAYHFINRYWFTNNLSYSISKFPITLIAFSLIIFFVICIIYNGRIKGIAKGFLVFVLTGVLSLIFMVGGSAVADIQLHKTVKYDNVEYVTINLSWEKDFTNTPTYRYGILLAKDVKLDDKDLIKLLTKSLDTAITSIDKGSDSEFPLHFGTNFWCEFHMNNGRKVVRNIPVHIQTDVIEILNLLLADKEYNKALSTMPEVYIITDYSLDSIPKEYTQHANAIYESLVNEITESNGEIERRILPYYFHYDVFPNSHSNGQVDSVVVRGSFDNTAYISRYEIDNSVPKTKKVYMIKSFELNRQKFNEAIDIILTNTVDYTNLNMSVFLLNKDDDSYRLHYNYYDKESMSPNQLIKLCKDLKTIDIDEFDTYYNYARIFINIGATDKSEYIALDTYIPISEEVFNYWLKNTSN